MTERIVLAVILAVGNIGCIAALVRFRPSAPSEYYFAAFLLALLVVAAVGIRRAGRFRLPIPRPVWLCGIVFLTVLAWRLAFLKTVGLWGDEETQYFAAAANASVLAATNQTQPPLIAPFAFLGQALFADYELACRFFPALFSSIASALVFALAADFTESTLVSLFLTYLFSAHELVIQMGYEGRPYSLSLAMMLLFCMSLRTHLLGRHPWSAPFLGVCTLVLLLSVGLQAPVALAVFFVITAIFSLRGSRTARSAVLAMAVGGALAVPLLVQSVAEFNNRGALRGLTASRLPVFIEAAAQPFEEHHFDVLGLAFPLLLISSLALSVFALRKKWPKPENLAFVLSPVLFLILCLAIYETIARHEFSARYTLLVWPLAICSIACQLELIRKKLKPPRLSRALFMFLPVAFAAFAAQRIDWNPADYSRFISRRPDWRGFYVHAATYLRKGDTLALICTSDSFSDVCSPPLEESKFYLPDRADYHLAVSAIDKSYSAERGQADWLRHLASDFSDSESLILAVRASPAEMDSAVIHQRCPEAFRVAGLSGLRFEGLAGLKSAAACLQGYRAALGAQGRDSLSFMLLQAALELRTGKLDAARRGIAELKPMPMIVEKRVLVELIDKMVQSGK